MKIIEINKSGLIKGEFINTYQFEDDTVVYESHEGFECENINGLKSDDYYINTVKNLSNEN